MPLEDPVCIILLQNFGSCLSSKAWGGGGGVVSGEAWAMRAVGGFLVRKGKPRFNWYCVLWLSHFTGVVFCQESELCLSVEPVQLFSFTVERQSASMCVMGALGHCSESSELR